MKSLALLLIVSAVSLLPTRAAEIPEQLKEAAGKTFASGKPFFIWTTVPQPVVGRNSAATLPVRWAAKSPDPKLLKKTPFCLSAATTTVDVTGVTNNYFVTLGPFQNLKEADDLRGFVGARNRKLVTATVVYSLIPVDSHGPMPEPVSNAIEVKVVFRDGLR